MKKLTAKEKEIMDMFWQHGPMFVKELLKLYPDPKPHFNTVSTQVRILESNGFVSHEVVGNSYRYRAAITEEAYGKNKSGSSYSFWRGFAFCKRTWFLQFPK